MTSDHIAIACLPFSLALQVHVNRWKFEDCLPGRSDRGCCSRWANYKPRVPVEGDGYHGVSLD